MSFGDGILDEGQVMTPPAVLPTSPAPRRATPEQQAFWRAKYGGARLGNWPFPRCPEHGIVEPVRVARLTQNGRPGGVADIWCPVCGCWLGTLGQPRRTS